MINMLKYHLHDKEYISICRLSKNYIWERKWRELSYIELLVVFNGWKNNNKSLRHTWTSAPHLFANFGWGARNWDGAIKRFPRLVCVKILSAPPHSKSCHHSWFRTVKIDIQMCAYCSNLSIFANWNRWIGRLG